MEFYAFNFFFSRFLYQNFIQSAEHLRFQVNALDGCDHKMHIQFLLFSCIWHTLVMLCNGIESRCQPHKFPENEKIFVGKLYENHTQISKCLVFLDDHVAILYVNFFTGIPHAVDNFNCKTTLDSVAHMHFELLSRPIFFLFFFFFFVFALCCL